MKTSTKIYADTHPRLDDDLLTRKETAQWLRTSPRNLDRIADEGSIPRMKLGPKSTRFFVKHVRQFLEKCLSTS